VRQRSGHNILFVLLRQETTQAYRTGEAGSGDGAAAARAIAKLGYWAVACGTRQEHVVRRHP